ncbi:hypothetical protein J3U22_07730 [Gilliamella sp. B2865]|uniref:hypothetical protein n=2 Tax=unclassified Gilliamella TaxID=2685620 RepID=UPI00226A7993|nr:hypothetical protein [Gilliamella sp. B2865]MCX8679500.1 hypothetical protein [Gilliamella sp. B2865]
MMNNNLQMMHDLIQKQPWDADILEKIQKLIDAEPNVAIKRMMGMSLSAVIIKMNNSNNKV